MDTAKIRRKRPSPLSPDQWSEIQFGFESSGNISMLSERFGISRRAIYAMAKKRGWRKRAGLSHEARKKAGERFIKERATELKDAFGRHLEAVRFIHDLATLALTEVKAQLDYKNECNAIAREASRVKIIEKEKKGSVIPIFDITKETDQIDLLTGTIRDMITCERIVLGVTGDENPYKEKENKNPIDAMCDVLRVGIENFNKAVAEGKVDPNTGGSLTSIA